MSETWSNWIETIVDMIDYPERCEGITDERKGYLILGSLASQISWLADEWWANHFDIIDILSPDPDGSVDIELDFQSGHTAYVTVDLYRYNYKIVYGEHSKERTCLCLPTQVLHVFFLKNLINDIMNEIERQK